MTPQFDPPGAKPPGFWPDTSNLIFPNHRPRGYQGPGFDPPGYFPVFDPAPPLVFTTKLSGWLEGKLGIAVRPCRLPRRDLNYPLLTFTAVDRDSPTNLAGPAGASWVHLQFDAFAPDYQDAELLQSRLFLILAGYRGPMGRAVCQGASAGRSLTSFTPNSTNDDEGIYRAMREYEVWYSDPAPVRKWLRREQGVDG